MTVGFYDINREVSKYTYNQTPLGLKSNELLFADDTLIVTKNTQSMHKSLHAIQRHSAYYGMELNYNKCIVLNLNRKHKIKFQNGRNQSKDSSPIFDFCILVI